MEEIDQAYTNIFAEKVATEECNHSISCQLERQYVFRTLLEQKQNGYNGTETKTLQNQNI